LELVARHTEGTLKNLLPDPLRVCESYERQILHWSDAKILESKIRREQPVKNIFDLTGKVAIVTGGRRGIGWAFTRALLDAGAKVAVVAKSDWPTKPLDVYYVQADLADRQQLTGIVGRVALHFGRVDILINNAGIQEFYPAETFPLEVWLSCWAQSGSSILPQSTAS
jgi:hypothetical protein